MRNINWIRALSTIKEEMRCWSGGKFETEIITKRYGTNCYIINTGHKSCLGTFILSEEYYCNFYRFSIIYSLKDNDIIGAIEVEFYPDNYLRYLNTEEGVKTETVSRIDIDKSGLFQLYKPSDLISFYKTFYLIGCSIEKSDKDWRLDNFIENPVKYPENYNYSHERIL